MSTQMYPYPEIMAPWAAAREESKDSTWGRKGQKLSRDAVKTQKTFGQQTENTSQPPMGLKSMGRTFFTKSIVFHMYIYFK